MKRITFNKGAVLLGLTCLIIYPVLCIVFSYQPPDSLTYCWYASWTAEMIINAHIRTDKRRREKDKSLLDAITPYINQDNAEAIAKHYIGVELTPEKEKRK